MMNGGCAPGRHSAQYRLGYRGYLCDRRIDPHVRLKENADHRDAGQRLRLDVLNIIDRGRNSVLAERRDLFRHLIGRKTAVLPDHGHDRDIDFGKDIGRRRFDGSDAEQHDEQGHDDEGVWPAQGQFYDPHRARAG